MGDFKTKVLSACESLLRVPPLLLVDEIFRISFGIGGKLLRNDDLSIEKLSENVGAGSGVVEQDAALNTSSIINGESDYPYFFQLSFGNISSLLEYISWEVIKTGEILGCLILFFAAVTAFLLTTENLLKLYKYGISILAIYLSYITAPIPVSWGAESLPSVCYNIVIRTVFASVFFVTRCSRHGDGNSVNFELPLPPSVADSVMFSLFYVCGVVHLQPLVLLLLVCVFQSPMWACMPLVSKFLRESWKETRRVQNEYGLSHLLQVECARLKINTVFRLFWISRAVYDAVFKCCNESVFQVFKYVMSHGTETFTGIIGLTVTVSAVCHSIGECLLWLLYLGTNTETDANRFGSISTVLFFILSLQTGLTSLDPEKRLDRLLKNIVLLGTALFHALHQMVAPLLHAFRTFQGLQIRAVTLSAVFLSVSIMSTAYLLRYSSISTWSLAVLALAIEFKIKIVISLVISFVVYLSQLVQYPEPLQKFGYLLRALVPKGASRVYDKLADQLSHEDVVFYLKSFANVAEFLTGIFLFVNAVWIFMFESASAIRAIGMTIHAYFNIWCEARKGWKIYGQRKTASMKIMSLADATEKQLAARKDDVCAICYEEMESAKVTLCGHLFHAVCLRKWLYVQNTCPLCHELLYGEEAVEQARVQAQAPIVLQEEILNVPAAEHLVPAPVRPVSARSDTSMSPTARLLPVQELQLRNEASEDLETEGSHVNGSVAGPSANPRHRLRQSQSLTNIQLRVDPFRREDWARNRIPDRRRNNNNIEDLEDLDPNADNARARGGLAVLL